MAHDVTPQRDYFLILVSIVLVNCPEDPEHVEVTKGYSNVRSEPACQPLWIAPPSTCYTTVKRYLDDIFRTDDSDM
uniref:Uncharacterized protein n=1 Tax=Peronospora matthiolae TaxID=2874970 RepID=A0AAV1TNI8_9STRA